MSNIRIFINNEEVSNDVISNMLLATGWEDTDNTVYYERTNDGFNRVHKCFSKIYSAFIGTEEITLCVHKNRIVTLIVNASLPGYNSKLPEDADFIVKSFYLSSILTEVHVPELDFHITNLNDKNLGVYLKLADSIINVFIPIDL